MEQETFDHAWADFGQQHSSSTAASSSNHPYQFHPNNPYDGNSDALAIAQQAFKEGSLQDACLALEAVVKASPGTETLFSYITVSCCSYARFPCHTVNICKSVGPLLVELCSLLPKSVTAVSVLKRLMLLDIYYGIGCSACPLIVLDLARWMLI